MHYYLLEGIQSDFYLFMVFPLMCLKESSVIKAEEEKRILMEKTFFCP